MTAAVALQNVTLGYDRHPAVHHVDTIIEAGSLTALIGPNGSGKSTLLKGIAGTLTPFEGRIEVAADTPTKVAYLPQQSEIDADFPISVEDLVSLGSWSDTGAFGGLSKSRLQSVQEAIEAVGLHGFERRPIGTLSGGQMQRTLFARLLLQDAEIFLLDEPFSAIDTRTTADLLRVVQEWHGDGRTIIAALHDIETVRKGFPQTMILARELISHGQTRQVLTSANLARAWQLSPAFLQSAEICTRRAA